MEKRKNADSWRQKSGDVLHIREGLSSKSSKGIEERNVERSIDDVLKNIDFGRTLLFYKYIDYSIYQKLNDEISTFRTNFNALRGYDLDYEAIQQKLQLYNKTISDPRFLKVIRSIKDKEQRAYLWREFNMNLKLAINIYSPSSIFDYGDAEKTCSNFIKASEAISKYPKEILTAGVYSVVLEDITRSLGHSPEGERGKYLYEFLESEKIFNLIKNTRRENREGISLYILEIARDVKDEGVLNEFLDLLSKFMNSNAAENFCYFVVSELRDPSRIINERDPKDILKGITKTFDNENVIRFADKIFGNYNSSIDFFAALKYILNVDNSNATVERISDFSKVYDSTNFAEILWWIKDVSPKTKEELYEVFDFVGRFKKEILNIDPIAKGRVIFGSKVNRLVKSTDDFYLLLVKSEDEIKNYKTQNDIESAKKEFLEFVNSIIREMRPDIHIDSFEKAYLFYSYYTIAQYSHTTSEVVKIFKEEVGNFIILQPKEVKYYAINSSFATRYSEPAKNEAGTTEGKYFEITDLVNEFSKNPEMIKKYTILAIVGSRNQELKKEAKAAMEKIFPKEMLDKAYTVFNQKYKKEKIIEIAREFNSGNYDGALEILFNLGEDSIKRIAESVINLSKNPNVEENLFILKSFESKNPLDYNANTLFSCVFLPVSLDVFKYAEDPNVRLIGYKIGKKTLAGAICYISGDVFVVDSLEVADVMQNQRYFELVYNDLVSRAKSAGAKEIAFNTKVLNAGPSKFVKYIKSTKTFKVKEIEIGPTNSYLEAKGGALGYFISLYDS